MGYSTIMKTKTYLCSACVEDNDTPFSLDISTKLIEVEPRHCEACWFREEQDSYEKLDNQH